MQLRICDALCRNFVSKVSNFSVDVIAWGQDDVDDLVIVIYFETINILGLLVFPVDAQETTLLLFFHSLQS